MLRQADKSKKYRNKYCLTHFKATDQSHNALTQTDLNSQQQALQDLLDIDFEKNSMPFNHHLNMLQSESQTHRNKDQLLNRMKNNEDSNFTRKLDGHYGHCRSGSDQSGLRALSRVNIYKKNSQNFFETNFKRGSKFRDPVATPLQNKKSSLLETYRLKKIGMRKTFCCTRQNNGESDLIKVPSKSFFKEGELYQNKPQQSVINELKQKLKRLQSPQKENKENYEHGTTSYPKEYAVLEKILKSQIKKQEAKQKKKQFYSMSDYMREFSYKNLRRKARAQAEVSYFKQAEAEMRKQEQSLQKFNDSELNHSLGKEQKVDTKLQVSSSANFVNLSEFLSVAENRRANIYSLNQNRSKPKMLNNSVVVNTNNYVHSEMNFKAGIKKARNSEGLQKPKTAQNNVVKRKSSNQNMNLGPNCKEGRMSNNKSGLNSAYHSYQKRRDYFVKEETIKAQKKNRTLKDLLFE